MTAIDANTTTPQPDSYTAPPFPSLYWLIGPPHLVRPAYLYNWKDIWRFTVFWTLIVYEAAHLLASSYAVIVVWWGSRNHRVKGGMGRKTRGGNFWSKISGMWAVPAVYGIVAGLEGVLAGSVVGLAMGAVYNAGGFRMSTWIPFIWSLANLLILIVSSFSIQGGL